MTGPGGAEPGLLALSVEQFLDLLASDRPAPGGGAAVAVSVAMAAALVAMAGRFSATQLADAGALVELAEGLRAQVSPLADADADAYRAVLAAMALPREPGSGRREAVRQALSDAADVPLAMAEVAAEASRLAERVRDEGNPNLGGDAVTAAALAAAGARAAAGLVRENLARHPDDPRLARAAELAEGTERRLAAVSGLGHGGGQGRR